MTQEQESIQTTSDFKELHAIHSSAEASRKELNCWKFKRQHGTQVAG